MEKERQSILAQFQAVAERKTVLNQEQEPLLRESKEIKSQIEQFDGKCTQARVSPAPLLIIALS